MCVVSAVHGYFGNRQDLWPNRIEQWPGVQPWPPMGPYVNPQPQWDHDTFEKYKDILKRLADLDAKLGQPDCVDPAKEKYMQEIERRLKALEDRPAP